MTGATRGRRAGNGRGGSAAAAGKLAGRKQAAGSATAGRTTAGRREQAAQKSVATPWGPAVLVEELRLQQQAGDRRFASFVQVLRSAKGERYVRFAYATDGTARRGPVTLRERDLVRLRERLEGQPQLRELLGS